jgi:hypothetical protein
MGQWKYAALWNSRAYLFGLRVAGGQIDLGFLYYLAIDSNCTPSTTYTPTRTAIAWALAFF